MTDLEGLRDEQVELRAEQRELERELQEVTDRIAANHARQAQIKNLLLETARVTTRIPVTTPRQARRILSRMGGPFTESEAIAKLGWTRSKVRELFGLMLIEKPPALTQSGRAMGHLLYRYTGPEIPDDPGADRQAAAVEAVGEWATLLELGTIVTPGQAAAAASVERVDAGVALAALVESGVLEDVSAATDRPMFRRTGAGVKTLTIGPAPAKGKGKHRGPSRPSSKVPAIDELLAAADRAGWSIEESVAHFAIEALGGDRRLVKAKFEGGDAYRHHKAWMRRHGAKGI